MKRIRPKVLNILKTIIISAVLVMCTVLVVFAEDYRIGSCSWDDYGDGRIVAVWDETNDKTSFKLVLYKSSVSSANVVKNYTVSGFEKNLSSDIAKKGKGTYFFFVYPTKGGEELGVLSEGYTVDASNLKAIKNYVKNGTTYSSAKGYDPNYGPWSEKDSSSAPFKLGWNSDNGRWRYLSANGNYVKSSWITDNGHRYYLDPSGYMATGWQAVDGKYYYLEPEGNAAYPQGAMWHDATTPDGYTVNSSGAWVKDGEVQKPENSVTASSKVIATVQSGKPITKLTLNMWESSGNGAVKQCKPTSASNSKVVDYSYDIPYENWSPGIPVVITVHITANSGNYYDTGCKTTVSKGTVDGVTGDSTDRYITVKYTPIVSLSAPGGFKRSGYTVSWNNIPYATQYRVKIEVPYHSTKTVMVSSNSIDLSQYISGYESTAKISVAALGPTNVGYKESGYNKVKFADIK